MKYHFTPPGGWMNDPNGMVVINGIYHLFYQYYPHGLNWGPMHWGHAVSEDGIKWKHKPVALEPMELGYAFSGSCILDKENVSGLLDMTDALLLAFFTAHNPETGEQQQCLAYSSDYEHFEYYDNNPVIANPGLKPDFRDPKVFKNPKGKGYSMALAVGPSIEFYASEDLINWEKSGAFNISDYNMTGICECPDCFCIDEENDIWILSFSLCGNPGSNIMPYFIGEFDGKVFVPMKADDSFNPLELTLLDYGPDDYAAVTFAETTRRLMIGWGENWTYAGQTPADKYRGKMTLIKEVKLLDTPNGKRIAYTPVFPDISGIIGKHLHPDETVQLCTRNGGCLSVTVTDKEIIVDRTHAVSVSFHDCMKKQEYLVFTAPRSFTGECDLMIFEDNGYYEIFADKGTVLFSIMTY